VKTSTCLAGAVALPTIFEDNHIIVVIKPQGALIDDMVAQLKADRGYVATVHRLDQVTGGVMVFAKSSKSAARLSAQIVEHKFTKTYLAVVTGTPKQREATLINYLLKDEEKNTVKIVPMATVGAKRAELSYETYKAQIDGLTLVKVHLVTGRSHQIRVQMAGIACPIWGDARYGKIVPAGDIALWAHELCFVHPTTEEVMRFIVNPPECAPWDKFDFDRKSHKTRGQK